MEERDYTGYDHAHRAFSVKALFPRRVLIDLGLAITGTLVIAGIALSGPLKETGAISFFLIFPIYFAVNAALSILTLALRQGADRAEHKLEVAGWAGWPVRKSVSALVLVAILMLLLR